jgi:hypothetical protein
MADSRYFVRFFERHGDELVASAPSAASDYLAAIGEALRRAQEDAAGAIVFAAARDGEASADADVEIILRVGEVPDTFDAVNADP